MPKINPSPAVAAKPVRVFSTRTLVFCALLAALQVVLARLIVPMPAADVRFSIEAIPVVLSGLLFGPLAGALVGFSADLVGCLFSGFGYNPIFALPPILYGLCGGLFQGYVARKPSLMRIFLTYLPAVVLGSILYQSFALTYIYSKDGAFWAAFWTRLSARSVQFVATMVIEVVITNLLFKSRIFHRAGLFPPAARRKSLPDDQQA